jgi:hypothetical protein
LLLLVRVLAVLVAFQLSGAVGLATELGFCSDAVADDCCTDCPMEKGGKDCPPACPSCHCSHGCLALPGVPDSALHGFVRVDESAVARPREASVPRAPCLPGLYRPPRFCSSLV